MQPERAAPEPPADGLDRRRLALVVAQAAGLRWQTLVCVLVVVAIVLRFVPPAAVAAWAVLAIALREARAAWLRRVAADGQAPVAPRLRRAAQSNIALGIVHGGAALFMPGLDTTHSALLTMATMSWAAGAVATSAPLLHLYLGYAAGLFVPTAAMWLAAGTPLGAGVALLIALFAGVQYRFARQEAQGFEESCRIRAENDRLVRQLAQARDLAEAASSAKSRFLAAASHDLRQPLHALTLHSGLLAHDPHARDAQAIAAEMSASIESLGKLLDSLLHISKLDAGVMVAEQRPIKLHRLIAHLVRTHAPQAAEKGLALRFDCALQAVAATDPMLLERLLRNLIDNAIKYTDRGEVCVLVTGSDDGFFDVCVRDTGRGIPAAAHQQVFEEFYQVEDPQRPRTPGLGLGLAIVRRLAQLLALPLALQSEPGRGTSISVRIPRAAGFAEEAQAEPAAADWLRGARVLFIDDEESVRRAMRKVLERFGCIAAEAVGSEEAVAHASLHAPDLVLADCRLRDGDSGIAAIGRLRDRLPGLPALLISGDTDGERLREAEHSGVPLLHKPVSVTQLRAAMNALLAHRRPELEQATA